MLLIVPFTILLFVRSPIRNFKRNEQVNVRRQDKELRSATQDLSVTLQHVYNCNGIAGVLDLCWEESIVSSYQPKDLVQAALQAPSKGAASGILNALIGSCCVHNHDDDRSWISPILDDKDGVMMIDEFSLETMRKDVETRNARTALRILYEYEHSTTGALSNTMRTADAPSRPKFALRPDVVALALAYTASFRTYPRIANQILCRAEYPRTTQSGHMGQRKPSTAAPNLQVLLDAEDFMVVNKPSGLVLTAEKKANSVPKSNKKGLSKDSPCLEDIVMEHCRMEENHGMGHIRLSSLNPDGSKGFVHRLDRGTSGCLVVARTNRWHAKLLAQFFLRRVEKSYVALVYTNSVSLPENGTMNFPIEGRPAVSSFEVLERYAGDLVTKIRVTTKQGRKHQVRIHCSKCLKAPILLDPLYGGESIMYLLPKDSCSKPYRAQQRFCLHADSLSIPDLGITNVEAPLPEWWDSLVEEVLNLQELPNQ